MSHNLSQRIFVFLKCCLVGSGWEWGMEAYHILFIYSTNYYIDML